MAGQPINRARKAEARQAAKAERIANGDEPKSKAQHVFSDPPVKRIGRPPKYNPELGERIANAIAEADYGLDQVCRENPDFPDKDTVFRWLYSDDPYYRPFHSQYARAKELQGIRQAQLALAEAVDAEDAQLGRLRYDARKWMASKLAPKFFGDKVQHTNAAGDGDATIAIRQENTPLIGELLALMESRRAQIAAPDSESGAAKG
jgi:hypothetical protein